MILYNFSGTSNIVPENIQSDDLIEDIETDENVYSTGELVDEIVNVPEDAINRIINNVNPYKCQVCKVTLKSERGLRCHQARNKGCR